MESYKAINRELILANQELKMQQSIYQTQIILLKNQLMDELEKRVVLEKTIKNMLIDNLRSAIKLIEPDKSLLQILQENDEDKVQERRQEKRQTTQILQELRTSNCLHRRSSIVASPIRRLPDTIELDTPKNYDENLEQQEENEDESKGSDNGVLDMSLDETLENDSDNLACIIDNVIQEEDEEEDDDEEENEVENIIENISQEKVEEKEDEVQSAETIVQDTMECESSENSPPPRILKNRRNVRHLRSSTSNSSVELQDSTKIKQHNTSNVVVRRGKRRSLFVNESIETVRHINSQKKCDRNEIEVEALSIGINSFREPSIESGVTSMALSELTCGQFADAPSSTPNSSQHKNNSSSSELLQTTQTRSSRRCKPKCLAEPSLHAKLRNESQTKTTQNTRRHTKKKNKK